MTAVRRLARIDLVTADPLRLTAFFTVLGFVPAGTAHRFADGATRLDLRLGGQVIGLLRPARPGAPYPPDVPGWSPCFQHIAIVVSDIGAGYNQLQAATGWTAISTHGPQTLPDASGGVTAFKFRDPEGHPVELIAFPGGRAPDAWRRPAAGEIFLGVDHSAISVADTRRSVIFYEDLGLERVGGTVNFGPEQARLDAVLRPTVEVTALSPSREPTPHLELLDYRGALARTAGMPAPDDIAATRLVFVIETAVQQAGMGLRPTTLHDPDGHLIVLEARGFLPPLHEERGDIDKMQYPCQSANSPAFGFDRWPNRSRRSNC